MPKKSNTSYRRLKSNVQPKIELPCSTTFEKK